MMHRGFKTGLLFFLTWPWLAEASPDYEGRLDALETQLLEVESDFLQRGANRSDVTLDERLATGIELYLAGDHQRASYIFMDIVERDAWRGQSGYQTAELYLARSLYENGYYRLSQRYLIDLLHTGHGSERTDGVVLLLQVAQHTGDWAEVNAALSDVGDFSQTPAYLYIMGRSMFLQGDRALARESLDALRGEDEWSVKAQYLLGVLDTQDGEYDSALRRFETVSGSSLSFRGSDAVHELSILARARLYYEQGQWSQAVDCYQQIPESSPYFPMVLYEMGWTLVRQEDYASAQQSFELLLLAHPGDSHALETRRLLADIKRELGQYEEAAVSYQTIVNEFEPVMARMETESADLEKRRAELQQIVESGKFDQVELVPDSARGMVAVGTDVGKVETMLTSLRESDANTSESEQIVSEIRGILSDESNIRSMPEFRKYASQSDSVHLNTLLTGYEFTREYGGGFPEGEGYASTLSLFPRTSQEREIQLVLMESARDEREGRLHRLKLQADSMEHRAKLMKSWISSGKTDSLTSEEKASLLAQIGELESKLEALRGQQKRVESKLTQLRNTSNLMGERSEYKSHVEGLESALKARWERDYGGASEGYRRSIDRARGLLAHVSSFETQLDARIQARVADLTRQLEREAVFVEAEKTRYSTMKTDVGQAAGAISLQYWQSVYEQVREMVLNADLGMVDIAWLQKDARSKALSMTLEERKKERDVLEQDFKQFLQESGESGDSREP